MPPEQQNQIAELQVLILELKNQIERMDERQEEMLDDIKMIKKAVYDPNEGLYARLRDLEQWKETTSKVMWMVITTVVGLTTATIYNLLISQ
tara:strand:- start:4084 stop:4359 length:276 start_codon:yes stop_codon:yes gene_type:complete